MNELLDLNERISLDTGNSGSPQDTELKQLADRDEHSDGLSWNIPRLPHKKDFHLFISYVQDNSPEVRKIVEDLEGKGMKCCYHERDFIAGQQVIGNINDAISRSMSILVVLSEEFVHSRYCMHEIEQALHARISENYTIIPIKIAPCDIPERLKTFTYIDAEMTLTSEMHVKILDAFVWNEWHRVQNVETNGFTLAFPLSTYDIGCRCCSLPRLMFRFRGEDRQNIRKNNFKISDEMLDVIQNMVSNSIHVKYGHICLGFLLIISLIAILEVLLYSGLLLFIVKYTADRSKNEKSIDFGMSFDYNFFAVLMVWATIVLVEVIGVSGRVKGWNGMTYSLKERSKKRLRQDIWEKINNKFAEKNKLVVNFQDMSKKKWRQDSWETIINIFADQNMTLLIIRYDFNPCKDLFIRRCGNNETLKRKLLPGESLHAYTTRLFRDYLRDKVDMLSIRSESYGRHKMANGAKCLCLLVEESILEV